MAVSWAETAALRDESLHLRDEVLQLVVCLFLQSSSSFSLSPLSPNWLTFGGLPSNSSSLLQATFPSWQGSFGKPQTFDVFAHTHSMKSRD